MQTRTRDRIAQELEGATLDLAMHRKMAEPFLNVKDFPLIWHWDGHRVRTEPSPLPPWLSARLAYCDERIERLTRELEALTDH